jgi:hypothetical protein
MKYSVRQLLVATVMLFAFVSGVHAQATRTWVSGVGDDANPCSRTAPCKTFAGAIAKTAAGGEIDALDPAGFGALTITKAITIDGGGGQVASVLVEGTPGIVVNAGSSDTVILRNLSFNGLGTSGGGVAGTNGVQLLQAGNLIVDHCLFMGFSIDGIDIVLSSAPSQVLVTDTKIQGGTAGIKIDWTSAPGAINVSLKNVVVQGAVNGLDIQRGHVDASGSTFTGNSGSGVLSEYGTINLSNSSVSYNGTGIQSDNGSLVSISGVDIYDNTTGIGISGSSQVLSAGNNHSYSNTTPGAPNGKVLVQ